MNRVFIHLTGTQGVGKTTLVKELDKTLNIETITNVVRKLNKTSINKEGNSDTQQLIFNEFYKTFDRADRRKNWISDRGLIDVVAYTKYLYDNGKIDNDTYSKQLEQTHQWYKENPTIVCYIPIEFPAEEDGIRCIDDEYRTCIDANIKHILEVLEIDYYILEGSIDERVEMMKAIIEFNK